MCNTVSIKNPEIFSIKGKLFYLCEVQGLVLFSPQYIVKKVWFKFKTHVERRLLTLFRPAVLKCICKG